MRVCYRTRRRTSPKYGPNALGAHRSDYRIEKTTGGHDESAGSRGCSNSQTPNEERASMTKWIACSCVGILVTVYGVWGFLVGAYEPTRPCSQAEEAQQRAAVRKTIEEIKPSDYPWCAPEDVKALTMPERIQNVRENAGGYIPMFLVAAGVVTLTAYMVWSLIEGIVIGLRWTAEAIKRRRVEQV